MTRHTKGADHLADAYSDFKGGTVAEFAAVLDAAAALDARDAKRKAARAAKRKAARNKS